MRKCTEADIDCIVAAAMELPNVNDITCYAGYYKVAWKEDNEDLCIVVAINKWHEDDDDTFEIYYACDDTFDYIWHEWTVCDQSEYELKFALTELINGFTDDDLFREE